MRKALRIAAVTALAAFEVFCFVAGLATWHRPGAYFGWNVGADGVTLINVEPDASAHHAGIRVGDAIDYASLPILGRINTVLAEVVASDATLTVTLHRRGTTRTVTMKPLELPEPAGFADMLYGFAGIAIGLIGLALVLMRPSRMTWGCALIGPAVVLPVAFTLWQEQAPLWQATAYQVLVSVLYALQAYGITAFAARFPNDSPQGAARVVDRMALPFALVAGAVYLYVIYGVFLSASPPHYWALAVQDYAISAFEAIVILVALSSTYASAARADRSRLIPVIASFALLIVADALNQFSAQISSKPVVYLLFNGAYAMSVILTAAAIAYGVVRHRVIDVNFIVSRTLVYTILTLFVVAVFAFIEYLFGKLLERTSLATILEIVAAVAIGISLNYLHTWLDRTIDVVLFRRRHLAEVRLERASQTLPHATSTSFVDEMLVAEPADALDLASAAVFRRNGTAFKRERATGWSPGDVAELEENDHLVARLRAELQPIAISELRWPREDLPKGLGQPLYAVPIASGHNLAAIALYGGHTGGEDLDPDERRSLRGLAAGAALAYDHLTAEELNRTVDELRDENAALRRAQDLLVERVLKHLS